MEGRYAGHREERGGSAGVQGKEASEGLVYVGDRARGGAKTVVGS